MRNYLKYLLSSIKRPKVADSKKVETNIINQNDLRLFADFFSGNNPKKIRLEIKNMLDLATRISNTELGQDFQLNAADVTFLQALSSTNLSDQSIFVSELSINDQLAQELLEIRKLLLPHVSKIDALKDNNLSYNYLGDERLIYHENSNEVSKIWSDIVQLLKEKYTPRVRAIFTQETVPELDENDIQTIQSYLDAFLNDQIKVYALLSNSFELLKAYDEEKSTDFQSQYTIALFNKCILCLDNYKEKVNSRNTLDHSNVEDLSRPASYIMMDALNKGKLIDDIITNFNQFYKNNKIFGLQEFLKLLFYLSDNPNIEVFEHVLDTIEEKAQHEEKNLFAENIFFAYLSHCINEMKFYDKLLSEGMGFHNAVAVRNIAEVVAQACEIFNKKNLKDYQSQDINFQLLVQAFRRLKYDNLGRRKFGDSIRAFEAFGISGAQRDDNLDPYLLISAYLSKCIMPKNLSGFYKFITLVE